VGASDALLGAIDGCPFYLGRRTSTTGQVARSSSRSRRRAATAFRWKELKAFDSSRVRVFLPTRRPRNDEQSGHINRLCDSPRPLIWAASLIARAPGFAENNKKGRAQAWRS
jgi:hypothetical protein